MKRFSVPRQALDNGILIWDTVFSEAKEVEKPKSRRLDKTKSFG